MAEKIVLETEIKTGNSGTSVKGLKTELRELTKALGSLEQGSDAFNNAAKRAGALKEQIRGINDAIDDADPEKKFGPFARSVQGLAGGFAAAQGAMALFGSESKDLEKTLVKVQGAMALSQGINSLMEFKNDFKDLGKIVSGQVVKAFTTLKGALIATGIGALVVTLGTLIANWKEFSKAITDAFPGFKVVTDFFSNIRQIGVGTLKGLVEGFKVVGDVVAKLFEGDFSGAIDSAKKFGARVAVAYNEGYAEEDRKIKIENGLKDRKFALDLEEAKGKDIRAKRIQLMKDELSILEKGSEEYNAKLLEIETARTELRKDAAEKEKARLAKIAEDQDKKDKELLDKEEEAWKRSEEIQKEKNDKTIKDREDAFKNEVKLIEEQNFAKRLALANEFAAGTITKEQYDQTLIDLEKKKNTEIVAAGQKNYQDVTAQSKALSEAEIENVIKTAEAVKKTEEEKTKAKLDALNMTSASLNQFAELAGRETAAGKALAVAQATIDTYVSAGSAYAAAAKIDPIVLAPLAAAGAVAAGLARVKAIVSVKVPGGSGGGGGAGAPPSVPQFNPAVAQQVQGGGDVQLGMKPQKVYVVESDIRGSMNKVDVIQSNAKIG
jgi:hypothetical protein